MVRHQCQSQQSHPYSYASLCPHSLPVIVCPKPCLEGLRDAVLQPMMMPLLHDMPAGPAGLSITSQAVKVVVLGKPFWLQSYAFSNWMDDAPTS